MSTASRVLVVAASRGIGLELVHQYRAEGARVVATARDDAGLARLAALGATALRLDVADAASAAGLARQLDGGAFDRSPAPASSLALRASASQWLYRASKAALNSVVRDAAALLAGRALCVALHPGWVRTDMGGSEADIDVGTSAAGLRRTLAGLDAAHSGAFLNYDGTALAW